VPALVEDTPCKESRDGTGGEALGHPGVLTHLSRGQPIWMLAEEGDTDVAPYADVTISLPVVPTLLQPIVATVPLQLFACELATAMGHDVDQPRNLAKSVTVE